jgi:hypothetical protein
MRYGTVANQVLSEIGYEYDLMGRLAVSARQKQAGRVCEHGVVLYFILSETPVMNSSSHADPRLRWQARVDAQRASGLTIAQFCQLHHYSPASFYQWKRKLAATHSLVTPLLANHSDSNPNRPSRNPFRQVIPKRSTTTAACVELSLPGGMVARVPADQLDALELVLRLAGAATL